MRAFILYKDDKLLEFFTSLGKSSVLINETTPIKFALVEMKTPVFNITETPDYVLVRKMAFSCNYRDIGIILQNNSKLTKKNSWAAIGSEFSGVVVDKGRNVRNLAIGDRVIPNGEYPTKSSDYRLNGLPTNQGSLEYELIHYKKLIRIPDNMSFEAGAGFTIGSQTTYSMIQKLNLRKKEKGLILGFPSNTSLFCANALQNKDVDLHIGVRDKKKVKDLGFPPDKIFEIPNSVNNFMDMEEIYENVSIYGKFDFVIDPFADTNLFRLINTINMNGRYITCGISNQFSVESQQVNSASFFGNLILNNISVIGNCLGSTKCLSLAIKDYENGQFRVPIAKVIDNDINEFVYSTFVNKTLNGKVIFKYS